MLAGHPRLLLFEFDLLPVLVGGPFAQNLRCIIWDLWDLVLDSSTAAFGKEGLTRATEREKAGLAGFALAWERPARPGPYQKGLRQARVARC